MACLECGKSGDMTLCNGCNSKLNGGKRAAPSFRKAGGIPKTAKAAIAADNDADEAPMRTAPKPRGAVKPNAAAPAGQGGRFQALKQKLAGEPGVTNPGGLAAALGRKKFGTSKFQKMAAAGRKK